MTEPATTNDASSLDPADLAHANAHGMFWACPARSPGWSDSALRQRLPAHDTVLRPLLAVADACWAYALVPGSAAFAAVADIATAARGKHAIDVAGDAITGREYFWNANAGKRGSVVILVPRQRLDPAVIFPGCESIGLMGNPAAAHTPAAFRFAQQSAESGEHVAFCLSRDNGFAWLDVIAGKGRAGALLDAALSQWESSRRSETVNRSG